IWFRIVEEMTAVGQKLGPMVSCFLTRCVRRCDRHSFASRGRNAVESSVLSGRKQDVSIAIPSPAGRGVCCVADHKNGTARIFHSLELYFCKKCNLTAIR